MTRALDGLLRIVHAIFVLGQRAFFVFDSLFLLAGAAIVVVGLITDNLAATTGGLVLVVVGIAQLYIDGLWSWKSKI